MTKAYPRFSFLMIAGALMTAMLALSACNTISGFGRDVESAGDTLSDTAEDVKD